MREEILFLLAPEKQKKLRAYINTKDLDRSLIAELCVRLEAAKFLRMSPFNVKFDYNEYGKPQVRSSIDFHYNVSHSGKWVLCAFALEEIGVDVEEIKPVSMQIAKQFFTPVEYEYIVSHPKSLQLEVFYEIWTFKESYIKARGRGLTLPLDTFFPSEIGEKGISRVIDNSSMPMYSKPYHIDNNYKCCVCMGSRCFPSFIEFRNAQNVCMNFLTHSI